MNSTSPQSRPVLMIWYGRRNMSKPSEWNTFWQYSISWTHKNISRIFICHNLSHQLSICRCTCMARTSLRKSSPDFTMNAFNPHPSSCPNGLEHTRGWKYWRTIDNYFNRIHTSWNVQSPFALSTSSSSRGLLRVLFPRSYTRPSSATYIGCSRKHQRDLDTDVDKD